MPSAEFTELTRAATEPTKEEIEKLASDLDLTVLPSAELNELSRAATEPTKDEIEKLASNLDLSVLPSAELRGAFSWPRNLLRKRLRSLLWS